MHVRKNNTAVTISGKDRRKTSGVLKVIPKTGKVVVKGVNLVKKHQRPNRQNIQGGMIKMGAAINSSKIMLFYERCKKATRISHKLLENGTKVRACRKYGETF